MADKETITPQGLADYLNDLQERGKAIHFISRGNILWVFTKVGINAYEYQKTFYLKQECK